PAVGIAIVLKANGVTLLPNQHVSECAVFTVQGSLSYNAFGPAGAVGAAFSGGTALSTVNAGASLDVTPASLADNSAVIGPSDPCATAQFIDTTLRTFTLAEIHAFAGGSAKFSIDYTGGDSHTSDTDSTTVDDVHGGADITIFIDACVTTD